MTAGSSLVVVCAVSESGQVEVGVLVASRVTGLELVSCGVSVGSSTVSCGEVTELRFS